jgi:hypothetical protein
MYTMDTGYSYLKRYLQKLAALPPTKGTLQAKRHHSTTNSIATLATAALDVLLSDLKENGN